jgi:hypothetical protein
MISCPGSLLMAIFIKKCKDVIPESCRMPYYYYYYYYYYIILEAERIRGMLELTSSYFYTFSAL